MPRPRDQVGALPWRRGPGLQVLLITSRETGRWLIPKGWPMAGLSDAEAAAREAAEEAGVEGRIGEEALGAYAYVKFAKSGEGFACKVQVFPLEVERTLASWREMGQRRLWWTSPEEAADSVLERGLSRLIRRFAKGSSTARS
ncbi:MAG: NUDIX hydrolase [Caulobacteraceae bacterium]